MPPELEPQQLCVLHFALRIEEACAEMRRETAAGKASEERRAEIARYVAEHGEKLFRAVTSGPVVPDEIKRRILNTFLSLINLRDNLERAASRKK